MSNWLEKGMQERIEKELKENEEKERKREQELASIIELKTSSSKRLTEGIRQIDITTKEAKIKELLQDVNLKVWGNLGTITEKHWTENESGNFHKVTKEMRERFSTIGTSIFINYKYNDIYEYYTSDGEEFWTERKKVLASSSTGFSFAYSNGTSYEEMTRWAENGIFPNDTKWLIKVRFFSNVPSCIHSKGFTTEENFIYKTNFGYPELNLTRGLFQELLVSDSYKRKTNNQLPSDLSKHSK